MPAPPALRFRRDLGRSPEQIQSDFYTETAHVYDEHFVDSDDHHDVALDHMSALIDGYGWKSVLDVGSGTGRALRHLQDRHDGLELRGVEPVTALIDKAVEAGVPEGTIIEADAYQLPFEDNSFDVVCECAVLHHVGDPNSIVAEMCRVARHAVFLSDENRFGQGPAWRRGLKYALYGIGLWPLAARLRNRGRPYILAEWDGGVCYSYSLYEALPTLSEWADHAFFYPLDIAPATKFHPLFGSQHLLLAGIKLAEPAEAERRRPDPE